MLMTRDHIAVRPPSATETRRQSTFSVSYVGTSSSGLMAPIVKKINHIFSWVMGITHKNFQIDISKKNWEKISPRGSDPKKNLLK